jgi:type II secretory pathway pseudopilin PulG
MAALRKLRIADGAPAAFTLVEIVIAIGIFTFALLGIVFLLGNALRSSSETQRDSALASVVSSTAAFVRSQPATVLSATNYFSVEGAILTNSNGAAYRVDQKSVGTGGGPSNVDLWTASVVGPLPGTNEVGNFLMSRLKP